MCIRDAMVEVIGGQGLRPECQATEPYDIWWFGGVQFKNLTPGVEMGGGNADMSSPSRGFAMLGVRSIGADIEWRLRANQTTGWVS